MQSLTESATARGDLATRLVTVAQELAYAVRTGDAPLIAVQVAAIPAEHLPALVVVLAGMVDVDRSAAELLAWVDFDEHGNRHRHPELTYVRSSLPIARAMHNRVALVEALRARTT